MWEFSLFFEKDLLIYFNDFVKFLNNKYSGEVKSISVAIFGEFYCVLLALPNKCRAECVQLIKDKIAEVVCVYYKPKIILKSIKNFDLRQQDNRVLLSILSCYDNILDRNNIVKKINFSSAFFLTSFVNFMLKFQQKKWQEIGSLINQNNMFLSDKKVREELVKFLISGLKNDNQIIELFSSNLCEKNSVNIQSIKGGKIAPTQLFYAQNWQDNVLYSILTNFPQKIVIKNANNFDVKFLQTLYFLFGDALVLD